MLPMFNGLPRNQAVGFPFPTGLISPGGLVGSSIAASNAPSPANPGNIQARRHVSDNRVLMMPCNFRGGGVQPPIEGIKPKKKYDIILRKGLDFFNFDQDIESIFSMFSLPSWISNRYNVSILTKSVGEDGITCYQTSLKVTPKYNAPKTMFYFFEAQKDIANRRVVYYVQTTRAPFLGTNCIVVQGKSDLINEFLLISINDYQDFFRGNLERPKQELFQLTLRGNLFNKLSFPYIEPIDISTIEDYQQHYFLMFRGGSARSTSYVGAYQAILDISPEFQSKLRSVIISSTSGLIGLAISTGQSPQYINYLLQELSIIGQRDKGISSQTEALIKSSHYQSIKLKVRQVLHDYGIMQNQLFDFLDRSLVSKPLVIQKLLTAIAGGNVTLQQGLSIESKQEEIMTVQVSGSLSQTRIIPVIGRVSLSNFYGLLNGYLFKGQYILQLAITVVYRFLLKKVRECPIIVAQTLKVDVKALTDYDIKILSGKLTMRQMYVLSGMLEFTVTTVDVDSQILRYFNHKTTPMLPVVYAIQMSFALPFLVKLPRWRRQWGRYYYHYRNRRKQIDLIGHAFMDGSVLDSSPLIYTQNEKIRQTFFARKPNSFTKIMCFGTFLNQNDVPNISVREALFMQFYQILKVYVPTEQVYSITKSPPPPEFFPFQSMAKPTDIPVVGLLTEVQSALKFANDNIIKQTFQGKCHYFPQNYNFADFLVNDRTPYDIDQKYRSYLALRDSVYELKDAMFAFNSNRDAVLKILTEIIQKLDQPQYQQDPKFILRIKSTVLHQISAHAIYREQERKVTNFDRQSGAFILPQYQQQMDQIEQAMIRILEQVTLIYRFGYFYKERFMVNDARNLQAACRKVIQVYTRDYRASPTVKPHLRMHLDNFFMLRKLQDYNQINSIAQFLDRNLLEIQNGNLSAYDPGMYKLNSFYTDFRFEAMEEFEQFQLRLEELDQPFITQQRAFEKQRQFTRFYIDQVLKRRDNNNLHIVFQSKGFHPKYLIQTYNLITEVHVSDHHEATEELFQEMARLIIKQNQMLHAQKGRMFADLFTIQDLIKFIVVRADLTEEISRVMLNVKSVPIPEVIDLGYTKYLIGEDLSLLLMRMYNQNFLNHCEVRAITTSGFTSYFAFLIASGAEESTYQKEMWNFKNNFMIDELEILREYQSMDWCLKEDLLVRDFQDLVWKSRYDVWANMEQASQRYRIKLDIDKIKQQFEDSREPIVASFTDVLTHVIRTAKQSNSSSEPTAFFGESNSLRLIFQNFQQTNARLSIQTRNVIGLIMTLFQQQIRVFTMYFALPKVQQMIQREQNPLKKEAMWRGVIITHFIKSDKYRRHIYRTLSQINLPTQIKIKEFYEVIPRKMDLTINAIDFTEGKFVFINRFTYPEMPLWAALVIGASYPLIFPEVSSRIPWLYHISLENTIQARRLFFNQVPGLQRRPPTFGSGDLVDSFPLSLLTNQEVLKASFGELHYTFLNFGISSQTFRTPKMVGMYCRRFLDMHQIRQLFSGPNKVPYINQLSRVFLKHSNILNSYVTAHDRLIDDLYSKETIRLPSRIDRLQYYKLTPSEPQNQLTQQQAYYTTHEKFQTSFRHCFVQVTYNQYTVEVFFISKDRHRSDIFADYNVGFKFVETALYLPIPENYRVTFNLTQFKAIYIKFSFVRGKELQVDQTEFYIGLQTYTNFARLKAVYMIPYTSLFNKLTTPTKVYIKILKPPSTNTYADQIVVRSIIDVKRQGLFCQVCCSALAINRLMFFQQFRRRECLSCRKVKPVKYTCPTPNCIGAYCLNCVKDQVFVRHPNLTKCNLGHQLVFKGTKRISQSKNYIRCDCCFEPKSFYYQDIACDIKICNNCFSDVNFDVEVPVG